MKKIILVDDHPVVVKAMSIILEKSFPEYEIVEAECAADARSILNEDKKKNSAFSLAIVDLNLPDESGWHLLQALRIEYKIPVIVMTAKADAQTILDAQKNGSSGFLQKSSKIESIVKVIKIVLMGGKYFPEVQDEVSTNRRIFDSITQRQLQVLNLVVEGRSNKDIAAELDIGEGHVRNMVSQLFDHFSVRGRSRTHLSVIVSKLRSSETDLQ
jgi:DNA-binding NarL/FixJ family response regulator